MCQCLARQYSDQKMCAPCGIAWDINDPEPPQCGKYDSRTKLVKILTPKKEKEPARMLPPELPDDVAALMTKAFNNGGAKAAYRIILDHLGRQV